MAVTQTGAIYKSFTFDGEDSRDYGIYITGAAVYNAPERSVEMISIPGRNGAYALDKGNFENIEVEYPAGIFADNESDFAEAISDFRNLLCSKRGYCRLADEYNPNEYRLAIYKSGLNINPAQLKAGEFSIIFECMPQRWLTSGETKTSVASGGTITNPTLFDSKPILEFQGYGNIDINGQSIDVASIPIGSVLLADRKNISAEYEASLVHSLEPVDQETIDVSLLETGDTITLDSVTWVYTLTTTISNYSCTSATVANQTGSNVNTVAAINGKSAVFSTTFEPIAFVKGTASTSTHTYTAQYDMKNKGGTGTSTSQPITIEVQYDGTSTITFSATKLGANDRVESGQGTLGSVTAYSTKQITGAITVDLDIGEAFWDNSGTIVSANHAVSLGANLPTLAPGSNSVSYDNTITNFKITPRWWKV